LKEIVVSRGGGEKCLRGEWEKGEINGQELVRKSGEGNESWEQICGGEDFFDQ
jgi:hypothetical protein